MSLTSVLKAAVKQAAVPLIYRYPPFGLQPERLATYLSGLLARTELPGDVAEIGCNLGGTSAIAYRMLRRVGWTGRYICYDTFDGFVPAQFDADAALGTQEYRRRWFSANSMRLVRRILRYHDAAGVKLVQGDIARVAEAELSPAYAAVLLDIDLSEPTYHALRRFWPRLVDGGIIYVDDCPEDYDWKARAGYARFCAEAGLAERYEYGFGVLEKC